MPAQVPTLLAAGLGALALALLPHPAPRAAENTMTQTLPVERIELPPPGGTAPRGHALPGDADRPPPGRLRAYLLRDADRLEAGAATPAIAALAGPARAALALPPPEDAGREDLTGRAAAAGVTPRDFLLPGGDKRTMPDRILGLRAAPDVQGYFTGFVPRDLPDAALSGAVHCVLRPSGRVHYALILLGDLERQDLTATIKGLCNAVAQRIDAT